MLLPSYVVDIWVSGSDATGNPSDTSNNNIDEPFATWPLSFSEAEHLLPAIQKLDDCMEQSEPNSVVRRPSLRSVLLNQGGKGDVRFVLQRLVDTGLLERGSEHGSMPVSAWYHGSCFDPSCSKSSSLVNLKRIACWFLVDGVEMDHAILSILPIVKKADQLRDGDALAQQASDGQFAIFMYLVASCLPLSVHVDACHAPKDEVW